MTNREKLEEYQRQFRTSTSGRKKAELKRAMSKIRRKMFIEQTGMIGKDNVYVDCRTRNTPF